MNRGPTDQVRRLILLFTFVVILVGAALLITRYLTYGKVVITTDNHTNTIIITKPGQLSSSVGFSLKATGHLSSSLKVGVYTVVVQNSSNGLSRQITIKPHTTNSFKMSLPGTTGVEPVIFDTAQDVVASSSALTYLNPSGGILTEINAHNELNNTDLSSYKLRSIHWSAPGYGVGESAAGKFFAINGVNISQLNVSSQTNNGLAPFAIRDNRFILIAKGSSLYEGSASGEFKKIYSGASSISGIIVGQNKISLIYSGYSANKQAPGLVVLDNQGHKLAKRFGTLLTAWSSSWSSDDKHVVVVGSSGAEIFDAGLKQTASIPQPDMTNIVWRDNYTFFYSLNDQLWSYSLRDFSSRLVANMPLGASINQVSMSLDNKYIYVTTTDANGKHAIRRVGLAGQAVPNIVYRLQDILPLSTPGAGYSLGLINFSGQPVVLVSVAGGGPSNAQQLATQELQSDGFDISKLQFVTQQSD